MTGYSQMTENDIAKTLWDAAVDFREWKLVDQDEDTGKYPESWHWEGDEEPEKADFLEDLKGYIQAQREAAVKDLQAENARLRELLSKIQIHLQNGDSYCDELDESIEAALQEGRADVGV